MNTIQIHEGGKLETYRIESTGLRSLYRFTRVSDGRVAGDAELLPRPDSEVPEARMFPANGVPYETMGSLVNTAWVSGRMRP